MRLLGGDWGEQGGMGTLKGATNEERPGEGRGTKQIGIHTLWEMATS